LSERTEDEIRRLVFPGSNCDHDAYYACKKIMGQEAVFLWHKEADLKGWMR